MGFKIFKKILKIINFSDKKSDKNINNPQNGNNNIPLSDSNIP